MAAALAAAVDVVGERPWRSFLMGGIVEIAMPWYIFVDNNCIVYLVVSYACNK